MRKWTKQWGIRKKIEAWYGKLTARKREEGKKWNKGGIGREKEKKWWGIGEKEKGKENREKKRDVEAQAKQIMFVTSTLFR